MAKNEGKSGNSNKDPGESKYDNNPKSQPNTQSKSTGASGGSVDKNKGGNNYGGKNNKSGR